MMMRTGLLTLAVLSTIATAARAAEPRGSRPARALEARLDAQGSAIGGVRREALTQAIAALRSGRSIGHCIRDLKAQIEHKEAELGGTPGSARRLRDLERAAAAHPGNRDLAELVQLAASPQERATPTSPQPLRDEIAGLRWAANELRSVGGLGATSLTARAGLALGVPGVGALQWAVGVRLNGPSTGDPAIQPYVAVGQSGGVGAVTGRVIKVRGRELDGTYANFGGGVPLLGKVSVSTDDVTARASYQPLQGVKLNATVLLARVGVAPSGFVSLDGNLPLGIGGVSAGVGVQHESLRSVFQRALDSRAARRVRAKTPLLDRVLKGEVTSLKEMRQELLSRRKPDPAR